VNLTSEGQVFANGKHYCREVMKMRRVIIILTTVLATVFILGGCINTPAPTPPPTPAPAPAPAPAPTPQPEPEPEPYNVGVAGTGIGTIAFVSDRDGNDEIYTIYADGSDLTRLINSPGDDRAPAWDPRYGSSLAFVSDRDGNDALYVMDDDGDEDEIPPDSADSPQDPEDQDETIQTHLTSCVYDMLDPRWSPDSQRIAFVCGADGNDEIWVIDDRGSNLIRLTDSPGDDRAPVWSPDGDYLAFVSDRDGNDEIYVMDADGSNLIRLTNNPASDSEPTWQP
jgi:TolB protein